MKKRRTPTRHHGSGRAKVKAAEPSIRRERTKKSRTTRIRKPPAELSETETALLSEMQKGFQLETNPLEGGLLLRRLRDNEILRASANLYTVEALGSED